MNVKVSTDTELPLGHDCLQQSVKFQLSVLRPKPGDVLVVKTARPLDETARRLLDEIDKQDFKGILKLLVIGESGTDVEMWDAKRVQAYLARKHPNV